MKSKFVSAIIAPEELADKVAAMDSEGYYLENMTGISHPPNQGSRPMIVLLFRLKERK